MTIEQAIKEFRTPTMLTPSGTQFDEDMLQIAAWLEELQTLRRKAEPVQPISRDGHLYTIRDTCPVCDNHLYIEGAYRMIYCCDCGQAIDWSKE